MIRRSASGITGRWVGGAVGSAGRDDRADDVLRAAVEVAVGESSAWSNRDQQRRPDRVEQIGFARSGQVRAVVHPPQTAVRGPPAHCVLAAS